MKKRILAALMVLSMMLTGLGYIPVQAAGSGLTITETEPVLSFDEIAEKDQLAPMYWAAPARPHRNRLLPTLRLAFGWTRLLSREV